MTAERTCTLRLITPETDMCTAPNEALCDNLRALLAMAESGLVQSFIGTGFTRDGMRAATWGDYHENVYEMMGSLAWLQHEYAQRHSI